MKPRPVTVAAWLSLATAGLAFALGTAASTQQSIVRFSPSLISMMAFSVVGAFVVTYRPGNRIGWLFCAIGLSWQVFWLSVTSAARQLAAGTLDVLDPLIWLPVNLWYVATVLVGLLLLVFPDGRLLSSRWRPFVWLGAGLAVAAALTSWQDTVGIPGPFPIASRFPLLVTAFGAVAVDALRVALGVIVLASTIALFIAGGAAIVVRFRRSTGEVRQQLKWFSYGSLVFVGAFGALAVAHAFPAVRTIDPAGRYPADLFGGVPFALALLLMPLSLGLAILRHRLYDIDLLINRTVVYGATSAAIALAFWVGILALQAMLGPLTSESGLAVAASTLVSFALFQPVRRRVQDAVDWRFDRSRYDAARTLDVFADRLRDELDLNALRVELLRAVGRTMAPAHTSLWLRKHVGS